MSSRKNMTFGEHLEELRWVFIRIILVLSILIVIGFSYSDLAQDFIKKAIAEEDLARMNLQDIRMPSPFMVKFVIALFSSIMLAFPYIMFEIYQFISPAIPNISKKHLVVLFLFSIIFFIGGCIFGYIYLFPITTSFFISLVDSNTEFNPERLNFIFYAFWLILVSGLIYQLPIISFIFTKLKIINYEFLRQMRSYSIIICLVLGALLSPPDPISQLLIALPLYILYELSIGISYIFREKDE